MIGLVISKEEKYWFSEHNLCPLNMGEDSKRSCYQKSRRVSKVDETVRYK